MVFLRLILVAVIAWQEVLTAEWGYSGAEGPEFWKNTYVTCGLPSQSPINIFEGNVVPAQIPKFTFINYETTVGVEMTISNNGHSATVSLDGSTEIMISGGGLPGGPFKAAQFHFHWGVSSEVGSEHMLNSIAFPMELHIVHYNTKYSGLGAAVSESDGLAVLGFMFEVSEDTDNPNYNEIINNLPNVRSPDSSEPLTPFALDSILPDSFEHFYRYPGSLTTPGCQESVTWTVFKDSIKISENQLRAFRELVDKSNLALVDNFRPVQPRNDRIVQANFNPHLHWTYAPDTEDENNVPEDRWSHVYESCGRQSQSPINLMPRQSQFDNSIPPFVYNNYASTTGLDQSISNNGHTVKVSLSGLEISVSGGGLPETYQAAQYHYHWGSSDMQGSEHKVDNKAYPMELHIVHFKKSLGSLGAAATQPEGLAVLGFFFEISDTDNPSLKPIIDALPNIQSSGDFVELPSFSIESGLPSVREHFYRYSGSLTTPGCFESVIWTVFRSTIKISRSQLQAFRVLSALTSEDAAVSSTPKPIVDNFRQVQNLNNRTVRVNFAAEPVISEDVYWTYLDNNNMGVSDWPTYFTSCASSSVSRQSPIDIDPTEVQYENIPALILSNFNSGTFNLKLTNNGRLLQCDIMNGNPLISGGGLSATYKAAQLLFHWGSDVYRGSEHHVEGNTFPMEVQIVAYNTQYSDLQSAMTRAKGLAIFGFLFEISMTKNSAFDSFLSSVENVQTANTSTNLNNIALSQMFPMNTKNFYRYEGSLTIPGCYETATWTIFKNPIEISEDQLKTFRDLKAGAQRQMVNNYRALQPINNRNVKANFYIGSGSRVRPGFIILASIFVWACVRFTSFY